MNVPGGQLPEFPGEHVARDDSRAGDAGGVAADADDGTAVDGGAEAPGGSPLDAVPATRSDRRVWLWPAGLLVAVWLATGFFVVGTDEAAVVRCCGRAERTAEGTVALRSGGLYWHLPPPFVLVDRVRINEMRAVTVGGADAGGIDNGDFLKVLDPSRDAQFLTGDRNVLQIQVMVHYRISRDQIAEWLYSSSMHEERLRLLSEAVLSDLVLRSGVDFVHTLGHNELRHQMLTRLREVSTTSEMGLEIEDVTIGSVTPPLRVKAEFVDVMNARADRETYINRARAYAEQRRADGLAEEQKRLNEARGDGRRTLDQALAAAESFGRLIDQFELVAGAGESEYQGIRDRALKRRFLDTVEIIYEQLGSKVVVDPSQPVDLTILRRPLAE